MPPVRMGGSVRLTIASRRSALARIQARLVARALGDRFKDLTLRFCFRESLGDQNQDRPLWQMPEKGVFTEDLRSDLLCGKCDLVVHSWKDLPVENNPHTLIAATLPRADSRDLLLIRRERWEKIGRTGKLSLLTSAPRRIQNLKSFIPEALPAEITEVEFIPVRGNMQTRIGKMWSQDADGLVLAKAALDRLLEPGSDEFAQTRAELSEALAECRWMVLPLMENPGAPAQGALAVEIAAGREDLLARLEKINCIETYGAVLKEREILRSFGGGCHLAIGASVLPRPYGEITIVRGIDDSGSPISRITLKPAVRRPPRLDRSLLWPARLAENWSFSRDEIGGARPPASSALWVARSEALPAAWKVAPDSLVWTGGLKTWKKLALRGVWVNGSAEGLGEQEPPRIETLAGELKWVKLTHAGASGAHGLESLPTYRLGQAECETDLLNRRYFFWTSGSIFRYALERNPWLRGMTHFCGPGNTARTLVEEGIEPHIFLDHGQWLSEMAL